MAIQVRCPKCRTRNALRNKKCTKCDEALGKLSNKDYWIEYRFEGKRKWEHIGRGSKKAAENRLREIQTEMLEGRFINRNRNHKKNLNGVANWYLNLHDIRQLKSFKTLKKRVENIIGIIGRGKSIKSLNHSDVDRFIRERSMESSKWEKNETISNATINKEFSALKAMLNKAVQFGELESNPLEKIPNIKVNNVRTRIISYKELELMLNLAPYHIRGVILMGFYEPMRKMQITQLTWDEVDLKNNLILLGAERTKGGHSGQIIPIHPVVKEMLNELPRSLQSNRVFLYYDKQKILRPFNDFKGSWDTIRKEAKLEDIVFHDLRHTAITNMRKAGNPMTVIMKASGHKTTAMFLRYNLVDEEDIKGMKWIDLQSEDKDQEIINKFRKMDTHMDTQS